MTSRRIVFAAFALLLIVGSYRDRLNLPSRRPPGVLIADLHVHPFPGDGVLLPWQLQREASRRGIDVIAVTGHNNRVGLAIAEALGLQSNEPIVLQSQELTAPDFHMIAVGVRELIDWRLSVPDAVRAIHSQGGAAIAAHPIPLAWKPLDPGTLAALDGIEVAHPLTISGWQSAAQLQAFFNRTREVNPDVAPIGSTDYHASAPMGLCRTYLLTEDRSAAGAVAAIRAGRTVAADQNGNLIGAPEHVREVSLYWAERPQDRGTPAVDRAVAFASLVLLALGSVLRSRR